MTRILIAEDEARIAAFVAGGLRAHGFTPTVVGDGAQALEHARSDEFDLLLLDIGLPTLDGWAVLSRLREDNVEIPVIVVSARDSATDRLAGLESGADDYITEPFDVADLVTHSDLPLTSDEIDTLLECGV